jgi:hypothetical protein
MDLHGKSVQNRRKNRITGEPQPAGKEITNHNNFTIFGGRSLFIQWRTPGAYGEKSSSFVISDHICGNLGFPKKRETEEEVPTALL